MKRSQAKKRGRPWRKPKASGGGGQELPAPAGPEKVEVEGIEPSGVHCQGGSRAHATPTLLGTESTGRPQHTAAGGHFLFRGLVAGPERLKGARGGSDWPLGFPPDSLARLWRSRGIRGDFPP